MVIPETRRALAKFDDIYVLIAITESTPLLVDYESPVVSSGP